ncbi:MAG: hypothetical protein K1W34_01565 [Lachnospiraceae bacterium]
MEKNQKRYVVGAINVTDSQSTVIAEEFKIGFPDNVEIFMANAPLEQVSYEGLMVFLDALPNAVDEFIDIDPDIIIVPSMTGSVIKGYEIVNILEQRCGRPVIVPALEMKERLKELCIDRIAIISAFDVELGLLEQLFFRNHEIEVTNLINVFDSPGGDRLKIDRIDSRLVLEKAMQADYKGAGAVIFDSPTYKLHPIIKELKSYIRVPILTVNQVVIYSTLKRLNLPVNHLPIAEYFCTD